MAVVAGRAANRRVEAAGGRPSAPGLRRLRWLGIGLPVGFIVGFELFRATVLETLVSRQVEHTIGAAVTIAGAVGFGAAMFLLIERAQRQIVRQNRELAAVNAVSTALEGELAVEDVIDAALRSVVLSTGAREGQVTVFERGSDSATADGLTRQVVAAPAVPEVASAVAATGAASDRVLEIPLSTGSAVVGRMRLHLPSEAADPDLLASSALLNIGHQLASAVQASQLLADLQRRKREGHALYDILLQISSQNAPADVLAAIVRYARDLLAADEALLRLSENASRSISADGTADRLASLGDGSVCVTPNPGHLTDAHLRLAACPVRSSKDFRVVLDVPMHSPDGPLGDLWIGRRAGDPYTDRDRGLLATLAGLATIAITGARMREGERQGAILAERDRIAREMHDSLAQVLGATHLRLRAIGGRAELADHSRTLGEIAEIADMAEEAYRDVREAILGLRESSHVRGLTESLRAYLAKYSHQSGVQATLQTSIDDPDLSAKVEIQLIRVIQEALTNVRKHARATTAVVRIEPEEGDGFVSIVISDNGRGFDVGGALMDRDAGFGLHTMRERMELVGGTLTVESAPGAGTRVIARVPGHQRPAPPSPSEVPRGISAPSPNSAR